MLSFGKQLRAPAKRPLNPFFRIPARILLAFFQWALNCSHKNASWPTHGKQVCHDCQWWRPYLFTDSGIHKGIWRPQSPEAELHEQHPRWDFLSEAIAAGNNPIDIASARERNRADLFPSECSEHGTRLDHYGQCSDCKARVETELETARRQTTEYRRVVNTANAVVDRHEGKLAVRA